MDNKAEEVKKSLIPEKSADRYLQVFAQFRAWKTMNKIADEDFSQDVLLVYFNELAKRYAPSTLWNYYSIIKKMLKVYEGVSIKQYESLMDLLKVKGGDHIPKKSQVCT